jgi:hypothetical protein
VLRPDPVEPGLQAAICARDRHLVVGMFEPIGYSRVQIITFSGVLAAAV